MSSLSRNYFTLLLALFILPLAVLCHGLEDYRPEEGLTGHNGVFQALPWTKYELSLISSLHATANYPEVMKMVREKLVITDVAPNDRRKIERMLKSLRPPPVFNDFLNAEEAEEVRKAHSEKNIGDVLYVIGRKLAELPDFLRDQAVTYLTKHTPTIQPPDF
ncbi:hypothetical protein CRE_30046 [Caenorhabditis remanei]|uniref:Uncharacterized protein n=1 Tax=Caenorhabditis remanei TaxID=31234 RepID=E3MYE0_CAERE|nr:hypothetical protein CRE_30046 [Caenorhabditis remanei]